VVQSQMEMLKQSGLEDAADEIYCGINGEDESVMFAEALLPAKAVKLYHGLQCKTELRTIMLLQEAMAGRKGWAVLYFHPKGFSHSLTDELSFNWRNCMMHNLVTNWEICLESLSRGFDAAGCHWKTGQVDGTQCLFAGNFWYAKSEFLNTLPRVENNKRIPLMGGVDDFRSRYEAEIILGSGRKLPKVVDYHPSGPFTCGK